MERSYRARAAGSDSVSYARRIFRKSGPPPTGATSGWNHLAMARYAALISGVVAVSPTMRTWYRLAGALRIPDVATASATTRVRRETPLPGKKVEDVPEKIIILDIDEGMKRRRETEALFREVEKGVRRIDEGPAAIRENRDSET
ncbi:hypothetical protein B296_00052122 [Ensete ventricosum]|uniref:Uncharacterized protein n=1 Tax=Ensete ventricosum TaxID=4639 RepID=A0A426XGS9_ENSVE|nr:hypothetical protein B296_00052122 [Ensete ventricosum]